MGQVWQNFDVVGVCFGLGNIDNDIAITGKLKKVNISSMVSFILFQTQTLTRLKLIVSVKNRDKI